MTKAEAAQYERDRYRQERAARRCAQHCGRPAEKRRSRCRSCLDKLNAKTRARKASGVCVECGGHRDDQYVVCANCRAGNRAYKARRHEAGLCVRCGRPKMVNTNLKDCFNCRMARAKKTTDQPTDAMSQKSSVDTVESQVDVWHRATGMSARSLMALNRLYEAGAAYRQSRIPS